MKIFCDKEKLLENINTVSKAVSSKSTLPILECIFLGTENGALKMITNDLQLAIEAGNIECEIHEEGNVALSARLFSDIIRKLPDGLVSINSDARHVTVISSGRSEFKILGFSGDEFPFLTNVEKTSGYTLSSFGFREMIKHTHFSVSLDDTRQTMTGELIKIENDHVLLVSSDGFRISLSGSETEGVGESKKAIIPAKALGELAKILSPDKEKVVDVYFSGRHVLFEQDNYKVVTRLIEGEFINYENIFNTEPTTVVRINRLELCDAIERSMLISTEQKKNPVKLNIGRDNLVITSIAETGTVHDELIVELDGNPLEIGFNPKYIADVLKVMDDENVLIEFTTPLSQCIIKGEKIDKYKFVVLPLRLKS